MTRAVEEVVVEVVLQSLIRSKSSTANNIELTRRKGRFASEFAFLICLRAGSLDSDLVFHAHNRSEKLQKGTAATESGGPDRRVQSHACHRFVLMLQITPPAPR